MDLMVLSVQSWVNGAYKGKSGYKPVTEDGITGVATEAALITALQIEIGIQSPNGFFGPATELACPTIPSASVSKNEIYILQGALYCKGYDPSGLDGGYGNGIMTAIKKFQSDAGLTTQDGITTPMIFKTILNTDAFVLISGGDLKIQTIQRNLNRDYNSIIGLMPCDGIYSRSTNTALIKALQHEQGNSPDGFWGANTMKSCPTIPGSKSTKKFMLLLQYGLYCNNYDPKGFDGLFGQGFKQAIIDFQKFSQLTADGYAGGQTWASLLVSTGDTARKGTACDCSTTITAEKAATIKANGRKMVGRYLTGDFKMTYTEIKTILNAGLNIFPIYETGGNKLAYFSQSQGSNDAYKATNAAKRLGFPDNTIIYFTVDFDAMAGDVERSILPYFKAVHDAMPGMSSYRIGIYAPRNVCSSVAAKGYSCSSYVCDMSSGFSGNLGYSLPKDWAIDQISTVTIGTGAGQIEIDNNICSGKDMGVSTIADTSKDTISLIKKLEIAVEQLPYITTPISLQGKNVMLYNFLRSQKYVGIQWFGTLGLTDTVLRPYLISNESELLNNITPYIQSENTLVANINNKETDLTHLSATTLGYISSPLVPDFWIGWGGDLATAMADVTRIKSKDKTLEEVATTVIGGRSSCSRGDIEQDIDAIYLANSISADKLGNVLDKYFLTVTGSIRRSILFNDLGLSANPTENQLYAKIFDMMTGSQGFGYKSDLGGYFLLKKATYNTINPTNSVIAATILAFSRYILTSL